MVTIGVLGWITSTAVELLGRRLTRWLPRTSYVPGGRPRAPRPLAAAAGPEGDAQQQAESEQHGENDTEEARDEHLV
jgi:NitT/TauT family transport system permease protein